jgi:hypothetical protein
MVLATAQLTVVDLSDSRNYTLYLNGNTKTQIYDPNQKAYAPNFTSNPLVIKPELYVSGGGGVNLLPSSQIQSLKWYEGAQTDTPLSEGTGNLNSGVAYSIPTGSAANTDKTLSIRSNLANTESLLFTCEVVYLDPDTNFNITAQASYELVRITNGSSGQDGQDGQDGKDGTEALYLYLWAPEGDTIRNSGVSVPVQADLMKGINKVEATYEWYIQDSSATIGNGGDELGGQGWRNLDAHEDRIVVTPDLVPGAEAFKVVATSVENPEMSYADIIVIRDFQDPLFINILGAPVIKSGQSTELRAQVLQAGIEKPAADYTYTWTLYDANGKYIKQLSGEKVTVDSSDFKGIADIMVDVYKKSDGLLTASGFATLSDMTDVVSSPTEPDNPVDGMVWMDTSKKPYQFYLYRSANGRFEPVGFTTLEELDPDANGKVEDAYNGITDLDSGNKLTRFERGVVRSELAEIVGKYLNASDSMPTTSQIDSGGVGQAYAIRKTARDIGVPTAGSDYVNFTNAYNSLRSYLSGMNPKAWDINSSAVNTIVPDTWDQKWNDYYLRYHLLQVAIQQRQHDYVDIIGEGSVKDAIAAVSNSDQFEEEPIDSSIVINAPFTSLGLPQFEGRHVDSWEVEGRNLLPNSRFDDGLNHWTPWGSPDILEVEAIDDPVAPYALHIKMNDPNQGATYAIGVEPNTDYHLSFDAKILSDTDMGIQVMMSGDGLSPTYPFRGGGKTSGFERFEITLNSKNYPLFTIRLGKGAGTPGEQYITNIKLIKGSTNYPWSPKPEEKWGTSGDRVKPITNPSFSAAGTLSLYSGFYGDGTHNDEFYFDNLGRAVKIKRWENMLLDGSLSWSMSANFTGSKRVGATGAAPSFVGGSAVKGVKYDGSMLGIQADAVNVEGDQLAVRSSDSGIFVAIPNADSGWGDSYRPTDAEIKAYFWGWRMCNGTHGQLYNGSGNKAWYPIGDTNMNRSTVVSGEYNPVPTEASPSIIDQTIYQYQVLYRLESAEQEIVDYDGILSLVKGANEVTVSYPSSTPEITKGSIKYALNLASVTEYLKYIIPTTMHRIKNAESKITDDGITNTVMNSVEYQLAMTQKANIDDLGNLATNGQLDDLANSTDEKIGNAIDSIDFSPYVTQSELDQTARSITAKFSATGGMNLIHNSIGFAGLDFWDSYSSGVVQTMSNNELDIMGFGSGFQFNADGNHKGITQEIGVDPGQPYTLSWYLNKRTGLSGNGNYRFYVQVQENGVTTHQIADNSPYITKGYEASHFTFVPQSEIITVRFVGFASVDATLTGIMLTIGDVPLQWSLATGELYNTNIRMDINGIRVSQFDEDRREVGYTQITPKEFAGYNDSEGNGVFRKIFFLNGDETVTTKLRATEEITMGDIKIIKVNTAARKGWAFIPNEDD